MWPASTAIVSAIGVKETSLIVYASTILTFSLMLRRRRDTLHFWIFMRQANGTGSRGCGDRAIDA